MFLAPGEETVAYINLTEAFRRRSRLRKDTEPAGKLLYVNGYLAGITEEYNDFKDFNPNPDLFKDIVDMDLDGVKDYFLGSYNNNKNDVSSMNISDGCKQILYTQLDAVLAMTCLIWQTITCTV